MKEQDLRKLKSLLANLLYAQDALSLAHIESAMVGSAESTRELIEKRDSDLSRIISFVVSPLDGSKDCVCCEHAVICTVHRLIRDVFYRHGFFLDEKVWGLFFQRIAENCDKFKQAEVLTLEEKWEPMP